MMALRFCDHPDVIFDRAPLALVLSQVRFSPILSLMSEAATAGFQDSIRNEYPHFGREDQADVQVGAQGMAVRPNAPVWRFSDNTGNEWSWRVGLAVDFVSLETVAYRDFGDFSSRWAVVLSALDRTLQPSASTRIGLRKINDFKHDEVQNPTDWTTWLRTELIGLAGASDSPVPASFTFSDTRYEDGENTLAVRYGLTEVGATTFRVDLDYFTDRPYSVAPSDGLLHLLRDFSDGITSFFHWILRPEMYEYLGPYERQSST